MPINRNRIIYSLLIIIIIIIGLISRADFIPALIYPYLGDVLYTLMIYFIIGFLFPRFHSLKVALISIIFCFIIELSQLYEPDWIIEIRRNKLGGLILGYGFLWSDLISYVIGGLIGFGIEYFAFKKGYLNK